VVTTAVEHLFQRRHDEFRAAFARAPARVDRASAAIDLLWAMISGPSFHAWLELVVAARTDARLRRTVAGITRRFTGSVYQSFRELFPDSRAQGDTAPAFAFAVLQGLALDRIAMPDAPHIGHVIDRLKLLGSIVVPEGPR